MATTLLLALPLAMDYSKASHLRGRTPTQEQLDIGVGDPCKAATLVTVRAGESLATEVVTTLPVGTALQVLEIGAERRAKVSAASLVGWISIKTKVGEPLILKRRPSSLAAADNFKEGGSHPLKSMVTVRAGESLETPVVTQLKPSLVVEIVQMSSTNKRRAKIKAGNVEGWISLVTKSGDLMLGTSHTPQETDNASINTTTVKALLEAGRSGNVEKVRRIVDGVEGARSRPGVQLDINTSDVRGRTALIYASAFGNKDVVAYMLTLPDLDVNALDDTQKSALHHASKKARSNTRDTAQADIVAMLVRGGAYVEARDHNGCTALMFTVANGDEVAARVLLDAKSNINVKDFEGHTPLDYAVNFGHSSVDQLLREHGAEADISDTEMSMVPLKTGDDVTASDGKKLKAKKKLGKKKAIAQKALRRESMALSTSGDVSGMGVQEISVVEEPAVEDENAVRERVLSKLKAVMDSTTSPKELEATIKECNEAGVPEVDLEAAELRVNALKARVKARELLLVSMDERSVAALQRTIANARKNEVPTDDIAAAEAVLSEELPRQKAREHLKAAEDIGDSNSLKAALEEARRVKVDEEELKQYVNLLRGAESKEQAEAALRKAMEDKDVSALRFAIQQAKDVGIILALGGAKDVGVDAVQIQEAEEILKVEEPRQKARQALSVAMEVADIPDLRAAIASAKDVSLMPHEYSDAEALLEHEQKKVHLLAEVEKVLVQYADVDFADLDSLKEAKVALSEVVIAAKSGNVAEKSLLPAELRRRRIHNGIEDIKGTIRVFCRVRPLSEKERTQGDTNSVQQLDSMNLSLAQTYATVNYGFDAVFTPGTQDEVFEDCCDLVQSAVDGYNVALFAYGQTGAGKTFTMYGVPGNEGAAPRTIKELFRIIERDKDRFNYTVMASMLELYRNDLVDLLNPTPVAQRGETQRKLAVRAEKNGTVNVEHLTEEQCGSAAQLTKVMDRGNEMRHVAATAMNSESSRSHLILSIKIVSVNKETRDQLRGKIVLCDLAGSERLKKSEAEGAMAKEAIEINKSLTALGDVIEALTKKQKQIPYRNHKLTQIMQDALGGTAKTLMFVNCSPASSNVDETAMSLKYATRAKNVTNKTVRQSMAFRA